MNLKVKQKIPLKIKRMGINGEGIGFYKKTLVFVPGALKGEDIFCQITAVKRNFAQARLITINKKSKFVWSLRVRFIENVVVVKSCIFVMISS